MAARGEEGVGLVEVVVAIAALMVVLVPTSYVLMNATTQSAQAREKTTALDIAEQWIETLNNEGPPLLTGTNIPNVGNAIPEGTQTASNGTYTVSAIFQWATVSGTPDLCTSGTVPQMLELQITVTWQTTNSVTDTTLIDYPPASVPSYGFIAVQLEGDPSGVGTPDLVGTPWGGAGGRVSDVSMTATEGTTTYSTHADSYGCAFMEVPPSPAGSPYTVTVGPESLLTPFTLVGGTGASYQKISTTAAVTLDNVTTLGPYLYDEGSYVDVGYPNTTTAEDGVSCPNAGQIQCLATGQAPDAPSAPNTAPDAVASVLSDSSWSSGTLPSSVSRIESSDCGGVCVGVGYGPNGSGGYQGVAVVETTSSPSGWTVVAPAGVTNLTQVTCPTSSTCLAIGSGPTSAVILGAQISGSTVTWTPDALPAGVTSLSEITCAGGTNCLAIGATPSGPVLLSGTNSGGAQSFVGDTLPSGVTSLSEISCAGGSTCLAIGGGSSGPVVVAGTDSATTQTFVGDTLPSGVTSLSQIACAGGAACLAIGGGSSGPVVVAGTDSAATQTFVGDALPAGVTSLSEITCAGGAACLAIGGGSSGPVVVAGTDSATTQSFVGDTLPSGVTSLSEITCTGTTACLVTGSTSTGPTILAGPVSATTQTFATDSLPPVDFVTGVACFTGGSTATCEAAAANAGGAVVLTDGSVTSGSDNWTSTPVTGPTGMTLANLPISVNSTDLSSSFVACTAGTCGTSIGPLFPFADGYSVGAGDCAAEVANGSALAETKPGASGSQATDVTLPLGLLPIEVTNSSGAPLAGATVTATVADPGTPQNTPCNDGTVYQLPTTGPDGLSALGAMYETYTVTVTAGSTTTTVTVQVTPYASLVETVTTVSGTVTVTVDAAYPLPQPVVIQA